MRLFTSESVTEGHPDKVCDRISDAVLDAALSVRPDARVACEVACTENHVLIMGEMTQGLGLDLEGIARKAIREIGYTEPGRGFSDSSIIQCCMHEQSPDIAMGTSDHTGGAGDQGMMFGYACRETPDLMPLPISIAHRMALGLARARKTGIIPHLRPDGKTQVTVEYDDSWTPQRIDTVVVSAQHDPDISSEELRDGIRTWVVEPALDEAKQWLPDLDVSGYRLFINPTGRFVHGGPAADTGLTGRKIVVDTYGGFAPHGGGAFCVDGDTEFLTPGGWKPIREYRKGDLVGQWNDWKLEYVTPDAYIICLAQNMLHIRSGNSLDMVLSDRHDVVLQTEKGDIIKRQVRYLFDESGVKEGTHGSIPTSFQYEDTGKGLPLADELIRLKVAFRLSRAFLKQRSMQPQEMERMRSLLEATKAKYGIEELLKLLLAAERMSESFAGVNSRQLRIIADECQRWGGDCLRLIDRKEADFIQYAFMIAYGTNASIEADSDRKEGCLYTVRRNSWTGQPLDGGDSHYTCEPFHAADGLMYCFSVPSGMLVLRRKSCVFVTGNSGKDSTKVDRSAACAARWISKNVVAAGLADRCQIQLAYAIGVPEPVSVCVDTFGTGSVEDSQIAEAVRKVFDLTPQGIINQLDLRRPVYTGTSAYGHFGTALGEERTWERTDRTVELQDAIREMHQVRSEDVTSQKA